MALATHDPEWYAALEAVSNLTDSKHDQSIMYYIDKQKNKIDEQEKIIRLYQRALIEIAKLAAV